MHPYQKRLEIIEMTILKYFQDAGFPLSEDNTAYSAEVGPFRHVDLTELAVQVNEALGLPEKPCSFEEFVGEQ